MSLSTDRWVAEQSAREKLNHTVKDKRKRKVNKASMYLKHPTQKHGTCVRWMGRDSGRKNL